MSVAAEGGDARPSADVVVVGSGAGASAVAGALGRAGHHVLMIEAGPELPSGPGRHACPPGLTEDEVAAFYRQRLSDALVPHGGTPVPGLPAQRSVSAVGGMLTFWSGICVRPLAAVEVDPVLAPARWLALLTEAERLLSATADRVAGRRQQHLRKHLSSLGYRTTDMLLAAGDGRAAFAGADALLAPAEGGRPVRILAEHVVRRILHRADRAIGVEAVTAAGGTVTVHADVVVVGAGVLGTPQLLVASGVRGSPALGAYLTDHTMIVSRLELRPELAVGDSRFAVCVPVTGERPFHVNIARGWDQPGAESRGSENTTDVQHLVGTEPDPRNRLVFGPERLDGNGLPAVSAVFAYSGADLARTAAALADHYAVVTALGKSTEGVTTRIHPPGASLHLMGTYRMGPADDGTCVTGLDCRVWGYRNLYLAGNGLLGRRNSANPTLTTVALGLHCARQIMR